MHKVSNVEAWAKAAIIACLAVFAPIQPMLVTVGILIAADTVFGMVAAYKSNEALTSSALRRTVSKSIIYMAAVCLGYLLEHYLLAELLPVSKLIAGTIGMVEMKSILENSDIINGGSVFKALVSKLGSQNDKLQ